MLHDPNPKFKRLVCRCTSKRAKRTPLLSPIHLAERKRLAVS